MLAFVQLLLTILMPLATIILLIGYVKFKIASFEMFLDDFEASLGELATKQAESFKELFVDPTVKKGFSLAGKMSGEARADTALRNKVVGKITDNIPSIKYACEALDIEPIEGLKLLNDPFLGPILRGFIERGLSGERFSTSRNSSKSVPEMR